MYNTQNLNFLTKKLYIYPIMEVLHLNTPPPRPQKKEKRQIYAYAWLTFEVQMTVST